MTVEHRLDVQLSDGRLSFWKVDRSPVDGSPIAAHFEVLPAHGAPVLYGHVKWDGCVNLGSEEGASPHLCGGEHARLAGEALTCLHRHAAMLLGASCE